MTTATLPTFGKIHAAKLEDSPRLQRVLEVLNDWQWHSTRNIIASANVCAVSTAISELRANGIEIKTRCIGQGIYEYMRIIKVAP